MGQTLGETCEESLIVWRGEEIDLAQLEAAYEETLEDVFPTQTKAERVSIEIPVLHATGRVKPRAVSGAKPVFVIPVFPGTNCEYESARAVERAAALRTCLCCKPRPRWQSENPFARSHKSLIERRDSFCPGVFQRRRAGRQR